MEGYRLILEQLGSPRLRACAEGEAGVPLPTYVAPAEWYGFPPALIPIWSDGSGPNYLGIWKHWFTERAHSFVKTYVGSGHSTVEIARTEQQFFAYVAIQSSTINGGISLPLQTFADHVELSNLQELDEGTAETGDDPAAFRSLSSFASAVPLESADVTSYDGTFPIPNSNSFAETSPFEFKEEFFPTVPEQPEWLRRGVDKRPMFEVHLKNQNFEGAWFTLNSSGWSYREAAICARMLAGRSTDSLFKATIEAWSNFAEKSGGGY